jgi:hypothetical protein
LLKQCLHDGIRVVALTPLPTEKIMITRHVSLLALLLFAVSSSAELPKVDKVAYQPFVAATSRLMEALDYIGAPLSESDTTAIRTATMQDDRNS